MSTVSLRTQCVISGIVLSTAGALLSGCSPERTTTGPAASTIAPPPSPESHSAVQDGVEGAYTDFWRVSMPVEQEPDLRWQRQLERVSADPIRTRLLEGVRAQRQHGITVWGRVFARISEVRIDEDRAVVTDCQDASRSGQAQVSTGTPRTVGIGRNPVTGTLTRDADGVWRVARIDYPGGGC